ncbi:hypothetical protein yfred0001_39770 [Yersinia frederiksenii ATCC 33641]|nr:hypothetical protein yfred0001_39770 [Yersinia frederiksenii ATCC 33641]
MFNTLFYFLLFISLQQKYRPQAALRSLLIAYQPNFNS